MKDRKEVPAPVAFTIPLIPPSVNHYKMRTRKGVTFVSKEAKAFKEAVGVFSRGRSIQSDEYRMTVTIHLGWRDRGDVDNFLKCVLDGCVEAGVIHSDAAIRKLTVEKHRDITNPRTEVYIEAY